MNPHIKPEVAEVSRWLHMHWDPIGCGVPDIEYESYALRLYGMLIHKASPEEIAERLSEFHNDMGLPKPAGDLIPIAKELIKDFTDLRRATS